MENLKKYVALYAEKNRLDEALKVVKKQIDEMEPLITRFMQESGIQNINIDDHTVYIKKDVRASFRGTEEAFKVIDEQGYNDKLKTTIAPQSAAAIVREIFNAMELEDERPEWVDVAFNVYEGYTTSVRKG